MTNDFSTRRGKVLLTGASGHLGANLLRRLIAEGHVVRALLRQGSDNRALDGLSVERVFGDLRESAAVDSAMDGCSYVFHAAAKVSTAEGGDSDKQEIFASNVVGTQNLLRAAKRRNVRRVVVTGSLSGTGHDLVDPSRAVNEDQPFYPFERHMPYESSKMLVEHECLRAYAEGLDVVVATSCAILGPYDYKPSRMGRVLCDFAKGRLRAYIPGGFEFVTARDIVEGHMLAMQKGRAGQKYIFSSQFLTVDELMAIFENVTGKRKPRLRLPPALMGSLAEVNEQLRAHPLTARWLGRRPQRFTTGAVRILRMHRHADCSKAKSELGYQPTSVSEAVQKAYDDFVRRGLLDKPQGRKNDGDYSSAGPQRLRTENMATPAAQL